MFEIGEYVNISGSNLKGKIVRKKEYKYLKNDNKDEKIIYDVCVNDKIIQVDGNKLDTISLVEKNKSKWSKKNSNDNIQISIMGESTGLFNNDFCNEIMLRHQHVDEAIFNLEKFIEEAHKLGVTEIRIVHGKQGGNLRKAVHEYLKTDKRIKDFRLGNYFEGQFGVTIAKLI